MSLLPYLYDLHRPHRLFDQHFGLNLTPDDFFDIQPQPPLVGRDYFRPWRHLAAAMRDTGGSTITGDKEKFNINLDVQHFSPDEISVKTAGGFVVVEGKHEEKRDEHGYVSRQFARRYALPEGCLPETVQSSLSSDGVLTVTAPRKIALADEGQRIVPIQQTGPVKRQITRTDTDDPDKKVEEAK